MTCIDDKLLVGDSICSVAACDTHVDSAASGCKPVHGVDLSSTCAAPALPKGGIILNSTTPGLLLRHAREVLVEGGGIDQLMIELCCSEESRLAEAVPHRAAAIRVPEGLDLRSIRTYRVIKDVAKIAKKANIDICLWISIPCTAGCPWRYINAKKGIATGDIELTNVLISRCDALSRLVGSLGGKTTWEWPSRCDLWKDPRVVALTSRRGWSCVDVASSAVDLHFVIKGVKYYLHKKWRLFSDDERITQAFSRYSVDPDADKKSFIQCRGKFAKESSHYPMVFAETFWSARGRVSEQGCATDLRANAFSALAAPVLTHSHAVGPDDAPSA